MAAAFFLSGASALVFEVLWQRMMILVFGASAPATTAILAALFLGIALGSLWGGTLLNRVRDPLLFYGVTALWIGVWGWRVPSLLQVVDGAYVSLFRMLMPGPVVSGLARGLMSMAVLLPATLGMGAMIPAMNRLVAERARGAVSTDASGAFLGEGRRMLGSRVAVAYGLNTAGAVVGCLVTGLVLIRCWGMRATLAAAACVNVLICVVTLLLRLRRDRVGTLLAGEAGTPPVPALRSASIAFAAEVPRAAERAANRFVAPSLAAHPQVPSTETDQPIRLLNVWLLLYGLAGCVALGYEVTWLRWLALYTTNSVVTFTVALATYLCGIALGSMLGYPWLARRMRPATVFALSMVGAGASSLLVVPVVYALPALHQRWIGEAAQRLTLTMTDVVLFEGVCAIVVMWLPAWWMGLAYPALCQAVVGTPRAVGPRSGLVYGVGAFGSALGAVVVGLWIIPAAGLVGSLALLAGGSAVLGLGAVASDRSGHRAGRGALAAGGVVVIGVALLYGLSGAPLTRVGRGSRRGAAWELIVPPGASYRSTILRYKAGPTAMVSVKDERPHQRAPAQRRLYVDDQLVASTDPGARVDAVMLAHLPLLLHPRPRRALTVGFGSGGTSWSMTRHGISVDCVEIEPEVPRSSAWFLAQQHGVLRAPGFRLMLDDARDYLHLTTTRYDVISTDVTNLQYKQNGNLCTRDYFALMKSRLTDDGIACAWVPMAAISPSEFKILLRSFLDVYPHASLWMMQYTATNFALLIGTPGPLRIDLDRLRDGFARSEIRSDLAQIDMRHPFQFVHCLQLDEEALRRYVGEGPLHTDDHPILEYTSAKSFHQPAETLVMNLQEMLTYRPTDFRRYVTPLAGEEEALFDRYGQAARFWATTLLDFFLDKTRQSPERAVAIAANGMASAGAALALFPEHRPSAIFQAYFANRLQAMRAHPE